MDIDFCLMYFGDLVFKKKRVTLTPWYLIYFIIEASIFTGLNWFEKGQ